MFLGRYSGQNTPENIWSIGRKTTTKTSLADNKENNYGLVAWEIYII